MASVNDLSLRQLEYVVAVADARNFHRAAERCHVSQPTLSAQVQQLEGVLGARLFERDRRGILLTGPGEEVVAHARRVLLEVADLLSVARRVHDPFEGTFRVGVIPTVAPYLLPDVMPVLNARHPKLRLVFREEKTDDVLRDLGQGTLDLGLLALEADVGDLDHAEVLKDPFVVALPRHHSLARNKRLALAALEGQPVLLLDDGHCFRTQALALCAKAHAREADWRATSLATLVQMVSAGAGITLLPKLALEVENRRGQLEVRPFVPPAPSRTIGLVWRRTSPFSDAFRAIAAVLASGAPRLNPRMRSGAGSRP
ncbi:MAG: LysR substrate-binding domain-containing protein [Myxococcota bacterium]|nr:LysR substrate-binding domain-containing protein [Myxococcota bacterium]